MSIIKCKYLNNRRVGMLALLLIILALVPSNIACASDTILTPQIDDIIEGDLAADLQMVIYYSPTCHHCHEYFKNVMPVIREKYIKTGKMSAVTREVIGNKQDFTASLIARCKRNRSSYLAFTEQLMESGTSWAYNRNFKNMLQDMAFRAGISGEECEMCLDDKELGAMVLSHTRQASNLEGFIGVPTIYINGKMYDEALDEANLCKVIDGCLN